MTSSDRDSDGSAGGGGEGGTGDRSASPGESGPSGSPTRAKRFQERQGSMKEVLLALLIVFALVLVAVNLFL